MDTVTGDAPQPGETPRTEGNPWSFDPDAAWWRGEGDREHAEALAEAAARPRRPRGRPAPGTPGSAGSDGDEPVFADEAPDAHAAGVQDTVLAITEAPADQAATIDEAATETPEPVERDHDERTDDRYNPPETSPEPGRNQPTVALDRGTLPDQPSGLRRRAARPGQTRLSAAELNLKRSRMENSPFWLNDEQHATAANAWPEPETHRRQPDDADPVDERRGRAPQHRPRSPRAAASGLFGLIALGLIASFFSWVSAEPFWLATGHGSRGVATVTRCTGTGVTQRCVGSFVAGGDFSAGTVSLLGVPKADNDPGTAAPARMVNPTSKQAYVGSTGTLLQLRWVLGFLLVLLCGLGIAGLTGTRRLESIRARRTALLMSFAGPLLLLVGFLVATY
jgi:hypothetical protein